MTAAEQRQEREQRAHAAAARARAASVAAAASLAGAVHDGTDSAGGAVAAVADADGEAMPYRPSISVAEYDTKKKIVERRSYCFIIAPQ